MILEAIQIQRFSQTDSKMRALVRVLNKNAGNNITAQAPIIGKPRKSGLFATVTVQIPFTDGQVISILFHSPGGDERKILADDAIIAFRWLLNKRDITHVVSPEKGRSISLEKISKRVMQIVGKNSEAFQKKQAEVKAQRAELEETAQAVESQEARKHEVMGSIADLKEEQKTLDEDIAILKGRVEKVKQENADLESQLAALKERIVKKKDQNDNADEVARLQKLGTEKVPGVRLSDAETAGKMWEMLQQGEILQEEWDDHVIDLYKTGAAVKPEPEPEPEPESEPGPGPEIELEPKTEVSLLPSKSQKGNPAKRAAKVLYALKLEEKAIKDGFHTKLKNGAYQDLSIETHDSEYIDKAVGSRRIYFTQYVKEGGDLVIDSEMVFLVNAYTGLLKLVEIGYRGPMGEVRKSNIGRPENSWANMFSKNLIDQGYDKAAEGERDEPMPEPEPEPEGKPVEPDLDEGTLQIADNLLDGMYDDMPIDELSDLIEPIFDLDEDQYMDLMEKVDSYATELTKKKAQAV